MTIGMRHTAKAAREFRVVRLAFALAFGGVAVWLLLSFERTGWSLFLGVLMGISAVFNAIDAGRGLTS